MNNSTTHLNLGLWFIQVNLCQKLLFLHELTHNMTTDCSLNYKFNTWKFQAQTWGEHVVYRNCFWHSEQFLYTTCSPHVLQKEELLTKIHLYHIHWNFRFRFKIIYAILRNFCKFFREIVGRFTPESGNGNFYVIKKDITKNVKTQEINP